MLFNQYPQAIANAHQKVVERENDLMVTLDRLSYLDAEIERSIALDPCLTNEQKRKAARIEAQRQNDYVMADNEAKEAKLQLKYAQIELERLRNEFSVTKLEIKLEALKFDKLAA